MAGLGKDYITPNKLLYPDAVILRELILRILYLFRMCLQFDRTPNLPPFRPINSFVKSECLLTFANFLLPLAFLNPLKSLILQGFLFALQMTLQL